MQRRTLLCEVAELSDSGIRLKAGALLADCEQLVMDWELWPNAHGVGPLTVTLHALRRQHQPRPALLHALELRNVQLDKHSLRRIAEAVGSSGDSSSSRCVPGLPLRLLALHNNGLQASDMPALTSLSSRLPSLRELRITSNDIGDKGARAINAMLLSSWERGRPLRKLSLSDSGMGTSGARALLSTTLIGGISSPSRFNLSFMIPSRGSHAASAPSQLIHAMRAALTATAPARGRRQRDERSSDQRKGTALGVATKQIALNFAGSTLGDRGVARLTTLLLRHDALSRGRGAAPTLYGLDLRGVGMGGAGAQSLASAVKQLRRIQRLDVSDNPRIDAHGFATLLTLIGHPSLTCLRLPAPPLLANGSSVRSSAPHLLSSSSPWASNPVTPRPTASSLATSTLSALFSAGAAAPVEAAGRAILHHSAHRSMLSTLSALATSPLRELSMPHWERLGPAAVDALVDALAAGSRLAVVNLNGVSIRPATAARLADALAMPACRLESLQLASSGLSVRSVVRIAEGLRNNTRLRILGLNGNNVGAVGARALAESARSGGALMSVSVTGSGVGNKWQVALLHATQRNLEAWRERQSAQRRRRCAVHTYSSA